MNFYDIDYSRLREDLMNRYGAAMQFFPVAMVDLIKIQNASNGELLEIAIKENLDLSEYQKL